MICRPDGDAWLLISQLDHSLLSGEMARRIGNGMFAPPSPFESVVNAIARHDCGWEAADREPELNEQSRPAHVFESDILVALSAWQKSVNQIAEDDAYAGLLVSLHTMALANRAAAKEPAAQDEFSRHRAFRIRRFVHQQIEIQENLRRKLEMRSDLPLRGGLAEQGRAADEDLLRTNFFLLEFLDQLSLNLCFNRLVFQRVEMVYPRTGEGPLTARISVDPKEGMKLNPWPFNEASFQFGVPARKIAAGPYRDLQSLRSACDKAARCTVRVVLQPAGS